MKRKPRILIIEDNPGDVRLTIETFKEQGERFEITVRHDGDEALRFLKANAANKAGRPDLILLDLNLPRIDGREVLKAVKNDKTLQMIPVLVLTTSEAKQDVRNAYALQANSYICKPVDLERFAAIIKSIEEFWFKTAFLPSDADEMAHEENA